MSLAGLADLLLYDALIDDGVLLLQDGALLAGWSFRGPDMASATHAEMATLCARLSSILRLGSGWMIQCDGIRSLAPGYREERYFPDLATRLIDAERREQFMAEGAHFKSDYFLDAAFTQTAYDAAGRVSSTTDANGNKTTYGYDDAGRRTSVTDALNHTTNFVYDAAGNQTSVTDANTDTTQCPRLSPPSGDCSPRRRFVPILTTWNVRSSSLRQNRRSKWRTRRKKRMNLGRPTPCWAHRNSCASPVSGSCFNPSTIDEKHAQAQQSSPLRRSQSQARASRPNGSSEALSKLESQLILEHTLADDELTAPLRVAPTANQASVYSFTLDDLEELARYVAAEGNHAQDKKLQKQLDRLFTRMETVLQSYADQDDRSID